MGEIAEKIVRAVAVVGSRYINWSEVLDWLAVILYVLFWIAVGVGAIIVVYKLISYPLKQMKRRNDLLEQMLTEMREKK